MKFATIGHLIDEQTIQLMPEEWVKEDYILSPSLPIGRISGHIMALPLTAKQIMQQPRSVIRKRILEAVLFAQDHLHVNLIQLGALTTSVTDGGLWLTEKDEYQGFLNHGDSYTAAAAIQIMEKVMGQNDRTFEHQRLAIIGAYGIIGEALSKLLAPRFSSTLLIGRRTEKLQELEDQLKDSVETSTQLSGNDADIIITATNHPSALLTADHLKENALVIDVSQPPNLSKEICEERPDVTRVDGGFVDFLYDFSIPGLPQGKILSCVAEVIMQAMEEEPSNHVGSIDLSHLYKTERWATKYGLSIKNLTNFGENITF